MKHAIPILILAFLTITAPAYACEALPEVGQPTQQQKMVHSCSAWVRLNSAAVPITAAYVHLHNPSEDADVLKSASAAIAERVELHESKTEGGIARMRELANGVDIPRDGFVDMKPGGIHIMLIGLKAPLNEGQKIPLTLNFDKRPPLTIEATVMKAPPDIDHKH